MSTNDVRSEPLPHSRDVPDGHSLLVQSLPGVAPPGNTFSCLKAAQQSVPASLCLIRWTWHNTFKVRRVDYSLSILITIQFPTTKSLFLAPWILETVVCMIYKVTKPVYGTSGWSIWRTYLSLASRGALRQYCNISII